MTVRKFKVFIGSNIDKEERWLTEMSSKGLHFKKYKPFMYYFEENSNEAYVYQTDFREPNEEYFQLYEDAGWEYVDSAVGQFHYFRTDANNAETKRIYSDSESIKETYQRMLYFYIAIFVGMMAAQMGIVLTWKGEIYQIIIAIFVLAIAIIYLYLFISLKRKINFYTKE